jgi:hypothetical protein
MKTNKILIMLSLGLAIGFASCEKEGALTPNPKYVEGPIIPGGNDTTITDTTNGGGGGGGGGDTTSSGGGQPPAGFMAATTVNKRVALLEDFTGVRCGFCPAGHDIAVNIKNTMGSKFIVMAVHGGSYAAPAAGWMDFNTAYSAALISQAKISGYPAGQMNRLPAADLGATAQKPADNGLAMGRGGWSNAASAAANLNAPVNIGAKATLTGSNLKVEVDLYYTSTEVAGNSINVALLQSGISSKQSGGNPVDGYIQNHVLRDFITGQWGETVTTSTEKDHFVRRTFNYTIPADYNGSGPDGGGPVVTADMKVVVFVTRGQVNVLNAVEVAIQ